MMNGKTAITLLCLLVCQQFCTMMARDLSPTNDVRTDATCRREIDLCDNMCPPPCCVRKCAAQGGHDGLCEGLPVGINTVCRCTFC
ncbi:hypothetical protein CTI12_AA011830 [Artemisia annua]|uniref:Uncharacterized protein n=1 Tax=Artemisia annua TaxID=35608 RepID=A0A2U1QLH8_ARTAN|nr:hypothetical protein CTI12_AA011830 [Artemisia annua]